MERLRFETSQMHLVFNQESGTLESLKLASDEWKTEYIGNYENTSYESIKEKNQWMGDIRLRIWNEKNRAWTEEVTAYSEDVRDIKKDIQDRSLEITYLRPSRNPLGIRSVGLCETYHVQEDGLHWYIKIKNLSSEKLEIGELSLPFMTNTDFTGIFESEEYKEEERWRGTKQKLWHEQRVQQHLSVNGSSSYAFLQRPRGDYPAVLFQILDGGRIEAAYQIDKRIGCQWSVTFEGPYYLSLYSNAARKCDGWKYETEQQSYSMNGNTSLILNQGQEREFHFVFRVVHSAAEMKNYLYESGQLDVDVQPGMAAPIGVPIQMRIRCKNVPKIFMQANNMQIEETEAEGDCYFYKLHFSQPGQKRVLVRHGEGDTVLLFYAVDHVKKLLENHAKFIVERQYYENPQDPYGRHHAFLPYDDALEMLFTESEESWQVGALDEYALPVAMYVAEKNAVWPNERQIAVLEEYIEDCLYGKLQERDTYYARRGMYFEERTPSDIFFGNKWDRETAESPLRSFNYPLISNIYYAMYKIADKYQMTKIRSKMEYLEMAFKTAVTGYELGRNKWNGAPAGATVVLLLDALRRENREWYEILNKKVGFIAEENAKSEYPFGSELYVDQTSHNQYEAMMRYYGKEERLEEAYRVTLALRSGNQPEWFLYGNEKRGNVCCWYGTPLNSRVLFDGFEYTKDNQMLKLGFAGLISFLTCIRSNGAAHGWYLWWPDRSGFDLRSLDTDMGMYGYLYSAKSYIVDDEIFGRCGYGCSIEEKDGIYTIIPYDGLGTRMMIVPYGIKMEFEKGWIEKVCVDEHNKTIMVKAGSPEGYDVRMKICIRSAWTLYMNENKIEINAGEELIIQGEGR